MNCYAKNKGPIGSPCWIPSDERICSPSHNKTDEIEYAEEMKGSSSGIKSLMASSILSRLMQLKAFLIEVNF